MKAKLLAIFIGIFIMSSCGNDSREEINEAIPEVAKDSLTTIEGEFIYLADAAVLKGRNFIYGVELDSVALDLVKKVEPLKRDDFDMVPIVVKAKIIKNPRQEGWDELVQIREILEIPERKPDSGSVPALNNN
ncbi:hypothetical protein [Salinimicrobium flavum]|uniref:Uncharacterized protein n=1 Tax=Salinimicrobium flavum TaxID=1737065 RepID=A0ABW5IUS8_9FLAO